MEMSIWNHPFRICQHSVERADSSQPEATPCGMSCPPEMSLGCLPKKPAELAYTQHITLCRNSWPDGKDPMHIPWMQMLLLGTECIGADVCLLPLLVSLAGCHLYHKAFKPQAIFVPLFGWLVRCCAILLFPFLLSLQRKYKYYVLKLLVFSLQKQAKKHSEYKTLHIP